MGWLECLQLWLQGISSMTVGRFAGRNAHCTREGYARRLSCRCDFLPLQIYGLYPKDDGSCTKADGFLCNFHVFELKMMIFEWKMMNFVIEVMNLCSGRGLSPPTACRMICSNSSIDNAEIMENCPSKTTGFSIEKRRDRFVLQFEIHLLRPSTYRCWPRWAWQG